MNARISGPKKRPQLGLRNVKHRLKNRTSLYGCGSDVHCSPQKRVILYCPKMHDLLAQRNSRRLELRGRKLNTNFSFSNFSGTAGISRQNPGISRPKSVISLVSRGIPNFLAPTPSRGRPPPHRVPLSCLRTVDFKKLRKGKETYKHKQFCPVTAWVGGGGVSRPGGQGPNVYVPCAEPKEHKVNIFVRVPGRDDR